MVDIIATTSTVLTGGIMLAAADAISEGISEGIVESTPL